uniref:T26-4p n=1 Tax=Thermococcus sp. 26/2 TaxID=758583 RepID=D6MY27_9EURY|nr:t26-4p [Thermococcus sp. 26/2]
MRPKSLAQLVLFVVITAFWLKIAWPIMTKEAAVIGAVGGLTLHWAFTNKGSRAVALIEPGTSGWRVMMYDMMLVSFLAALAQHAGNVSALLDALKNSVQNSALLLALVGGIGIDYSVGG